MEAENRSTGVAASQNSGGSTLSQVEQALPSHRSSAEKASKAAQSANNPAEPEAAKQKAVSVYESMTRSATFKAAAMEIAKPNFPQADQLPRITSLPFINMGNMLLFDYYLFGKIVWSLALKISRLRQRFRKRSLQLFLSSIIFSGLLVSVVPYIAWSRLSVQISLSLIERSIVVTAFTLTSLLIGLPLQLRRLARKTMRLRLDYLQALLAKRSPPGPDPLKTTKASWIQWGEGRIGGPNLPVLVATEGNKFPGFGHEQIHQLLVCQPRHKTSFSIQPTAIPKKHIAQDVSPFIHNAIMNALVRSKFPNTMIGSAIVIDGASILKGSPWLDNQGRPLLRVSQDELPRLKTSKTPIREYWAIQILFPEQATAATLFVRCFSAGPALAIELNLLTLGPIVGDDHVLREYVRHLSSQFDRSSRRSPRSRSTMRTSPYLRSLASTQNTPQYHASNAATKLDLNKIPHPGNPEEQAALEDYAMRLQSKSSYWPGHQFENCAKLADWRKKHSLEISDQYFGNTECWATIRSLYETIAYAIFDELHDRGFDVANYRDREGRINLHFKHFDRLRKGNQKNDSKSVESLEREKPSVNGIPEISPTNSSSEAMRH